MTSRGVTLIDPVCGTSVDPESSLREAMHEGVVYVFCTPGCKAAFETAPEAFVSELGALTRKAIVSALLSVVVLAVGLASAGRVDGLERAGALLQLVLTTLILFWCGASFMRGLARGIRHLSFGADSLVGTGIGLAYGYGALAIFLPGVLLSESAVPRLYFETAAWVVTISLVGKLLVSKLAKEVSTSMLDSGIPQNMRGTRKESSLVQGRAHGVASVFVPTVTVIAVATLFAWLWRGPEPALPLALSAATSVLIIACPAAIALATPIAMRAATERASQMGIVLKSADTLERLSGITRLVLNKAGTLTEGRFTVTDVLSVCERDTRELMALAASAEKASEHPAGQAIVSHAHGIGALVPSPTAFEALPGRGVRAKVNGVEVLVGNGRLLAESGVDGGRLLDGARHLAAEGKSSSFVVANGEKQGIIGMSDQLRAESVDAVARMRASGLRAVMLTGESADVASRIGEDVGLDEVLPEVEPKSKASEVEKLQEAGHRVAMIGYGVHDAVALARADVGIAIDSDPGGAAEAASAALVTNNLTSVVDAVLLGRATMRIVRQNVYGALAYNVVGISLAAGALYPLFGIVLSPVVAAVASATCSASVVANALRLRKFEDSSGVSA